MENPRSRVHAARASAALAGASLAAALGACSSNAAQPSTAPATPSQGGAQSGSTTPATAAQSAAFKNLKDVDTATTREFVGAVDGSDIYAAMTVTTDAATGKPKSAVAYFCDSKNVANWFSSTTFDGDKIVFTSRNGATFDANVKDNTISGTVDLAGTKRDVAVKEVSADGEAGLYLADHTIDPDLANTERGGWIVLPDGTQRGAIRSNTTLLPGGNISPANPQVVVAGREIMLRAITHIIGLGSCI